jgi:pimeloyl-ACP methyl ester carboxylesterase
MKGALTFAILALGSFAAAGAAQPPKIDLKPCTGIPGVPPEARCGTYEVWENRAAKAGRKIPLRVLVVPAQGPDRLNDPFVLFEGGPGGSSVESVSDVVAGFGALLKRRDLLLVDFRGTGGSAGLFCPEMQGSAGLQAAMDHYLSPDRAKACAERLARTADLSQYNNDSSVDDVDEVRAALGYDKINLYGGSGGSRSVLVYLRRHPDKVRTAIVASVAPPDERGPFLMAQYAQRALDGLIAECAGDPACRAAFPRLRAEVAAVLRQAATAPAAVTLTDIETGKPLKVRLTRNGVAQTLRYMLYRPWAAAAIPLTVHRAAGGDWRPMAEYARSFLGGADFGSIADGYYLSLTCSEDVPFIREDEIPAAVRGTFLGDFRIRSQQAACAVWPVPPVGREFLAPVVSDVPTLLVSGERDPVTPPSSAERAARTLANSLHVVVPDAGHGYGGITGAFECVSGLELRFIETGTVKGLDTSCLERTRRPAFVLKREPEVAVPAGRLARLVGTYKDRESGMELRIEPVGRRLRATIAGESPKLLVASSPTRFRMEGMIPGYTLVFQLSGGRAAALTLEMPGAPNVKLARVPS